MPDFGHKITTESFYEGKPDMIRIEIKENIITTHDQLLNDVIKSLTLIKSTPTPKLTIEIHMDKYNQPMRITRTYVQSQEKMR